MSVKAVRWEDGRVEAGSEFEPMFIDECHQLNGKTLYAVRHRSYVLSTDGRWFYEPRPSNRTDEFLALCRFETFEEAGEAMLRQPQEGTYGKAWKHFFDEQSREDFEDKLERKKR